MKKIIMAIDNNNLEEKIKNQKGIEIICQNLQYREAILEIMEKIKNIEFLLISEKIPGEINIEDLIKKIKTINNKINIIFFLEKENIEKKEKLKKLGIKNIYINNKINSNKIINIIDKNKLEEKNKKKITGDKIKNKIIIITGEKKSGKTTITNLLIINLIKKNKKILLINLNNKIEKNYLILLGKKYLKNNYKKNIIIKNKKELEKEIKINKNLYFAFYFNKIFNNKKLNNLKSKKIYINNILENYRKNYDYILVDVGNNSNRFLRQEIIKKCNKKIVVIDKNFLGIKGIRDFIAKRKKEESNESKGLHIIQNKYYFNSISYSIIKNIFGKSIKIDIILYNKKYKNLAKKFLKREKVKFKNLATKKIEKLLK